MIRVVFDANVFVSALLSPRGAPAELLRLVEGEDSRFTLVTSLDLLEELGRVLGYRHLSRQLPNGFSAPILLVRLIELSEIVSDTETARGVCRDPEDDRCLSAALEGRAGFVVTGDRDLLDLGTHRGVEIVAPRRFLHVLDG